MRTAQTSDPFHQIFLVWGEIQVLHQSVEGGDEGSLHQGCLFEAADAGLCNRETSNTSLNSPKLQLRYHKVAQNLQSDTRNQQENKRNKVKIKVEGF